MLEKIALYFGVIVAVIQSISELVKIVEAPGNGPEKKQAVLDMISVMYDEINKLTPLPIAKATILSISSAIIDILVALYNITGIFRKE